MEQQLTALDAEQKASFGALAQDAKFGDEKTLQGIFHTNAMVHGSGQSIFPISSRINHGCDANAVYKFNANIGRVTIHASRDIAAGDEICIYCGDDGADPFLEVRLCGESPALTSSIYAHAESKQHTSTGRALAPTAASVNIHAN